MFNFVLSLSFCPADFTYQIDKSYAKQIVHFWGGGY